jgi:hypothetical protein
MSIDPIELFNTQEKIGPCNATPDRYNTSIIILKPTRVIYLVFVFPAGSS